MRWLFCRGSSEVLRYLGRYLDVKVLWSLFQGVALEIVRLINKKCSAIKAASFESCCLVGGIADSLDKHAGAG